MELALYCPIYGFYERQEDTIGRRGDFYTSVSVGSLFGELLGWQFAEWLSDCGVSHQGSGPRDWDANIQAPAADGERLQIVEAGAHDGRLAADILSWLRRRRPSLFEQLEYWIVEPSPRLQGLQQRTLEGFAGHVWWALDLEEWRRRGPQSQINGVVFSNELLDSFPVHRFGWDARHRAWFEWGVAVRDENFVWIRLEAGQSEDSSAPPGETPGVSVRPDASGLERFAFPVELLEALPDQFTIEISPAAEQWWRRAAEALGCGKLLTLDYGLTAEELLGPQRKNGTLRAFTKHHLSADLLARPGEQDLTAHVNFSALQTAGEAAGLKTEAFETQEQFLNRIAARVWLSTSGFGEWSPAKTRQFQTLTHPEHFGRAFRALIQARPAPSTSWIHRANS